MANKANQQKKKEAKEEVLKKLILSNASDLARDFLFYGWKDDEGLKNGQIQDAVEKGIVTKAEIIEAFSNELNEWW